MLSLGCRHTCHYTKWVFACYRIFFIVHQVVLCSLDRNLAVLKRSCEFVCFKPPHPVRFLQNECPALRISHQPMKGDFKFCWAHETCSLIFEYDFDTIRRPTLEEKKVCFLAKTIYFLVL